MLKKVFVLILFLTVSIPVFSFSDQTTTERIINENKEYIEFLNICISNFAEKEEEKDKLFEIYQYHFNAEVSFLQSQYKRAFKDVYKSQTENDNLYNLILTDYYLEHTKLLLDRMAPSIIKSKNQSARLYLKLAYRDMSICRSLQKVALATRPHLHSYRMYKFRDALKLARRSIRYGLLALLESQDYDTRVKIYNHLFEIEREKGNPFYTRFLSKTEQDFLNEFHRDFDDYEKEYRPELLQKRKDYVEKNINVNLEQLDDSYASKFIFEKTISRRVRFKMEKRVADYLQNAEFGKVNDIVRKYVTDFNFKLIEATIEIVQTNKKEDYPDFNFDLLKTHHYDNYNRIRKESLLDLFITKVRVVDDIEEKSASEVKKDDAVEKTDDEVNENDDENTN